MPNPAAAPSVPPRASRRLPPGVLVVPALAVLAWLTCTYPSASVLATWPASAWMAVLWCVPVALLLGVVAREDEWRTPPALLLAGALLLVATSAASALLSPYAESSLPRTWPAVGGTALFLWLHHRWSAGRDATSWRSLVGRAMEVAGWLICGVSLLQWSKGHWPLPWGGRNDSPFGHSTYTAGAVVLFFPWLLLATWSHRGPGRIIRLAGLAAALLVLVSTSSRGGALALAAVGAAGAAVLVGRAPWTTPRKGVAAGALLALGAIVVLTNPRLRDLVRQRQWSADARASNVQREAMLSAGLRLGAQRPWLGWGPGTVPIIYPHVRAQLDGGTENVLQLHNTPVQVWATLGIPGVVALALLLGGTWRAIRRNGGSPPEWAATGSLLGYGIVALTDHQLDLPVFAGGLAVNLAALTAASGAPAHGVALARAGRILVGALTIAAGIPVLVATARDLPARAAYEDALVALGAGRTPEFLAALDRATTQRPGDPYFQHQAAAHLLERRQHEREPARQAALLLQAVTRLESSLATGVHTEFARFNLGWLYLDAGQPARAVGHFTAAAHLVPDKGGVYFGLGLAHLAAGDHRAATRAFALEAVNDPRSLTGPAWELPQLTPLLPGVLAEARLVLASAVKSHPPAAPAAAWIRWWWGEPFSAESLRPGFNAASAGLLAAWPVLAAGEPPPAGNAPWQRAAAAWQRSRTEGARPELFLAAADGDRALAAALARRAGRYRDDFRTFLAAPAGDEPALVRTLRHQRTGYGVLALHPEGPPPADAYIVQENRVAVDLAAGLFPVKGWLPGRFLLAMLPERTR